MATPLKDHVSSLRVIIVITGLVGLLLFFGSVALDEHNVDEVWLLLSIFSAVSILFALMMFFMVKQLEDDIKKKQLDSEVEPTISYNTEEIEIINMLFGLEIMLSIISKTKAPDFKEWFKLHYLNKSGPNYNQTGKVNREGLIDDVIDAIVGERPVTS